MTTLRGSGPFLKRALLIVCIKNKRKSTPEKYLATVAALFTNPFDAFALQAMAPKVSTTALLVFLDFLIHAGKKKH